MSSLPPEYWALPITNDSLTVDERVTTIVETTQFVLFCCTITLYFIIVWALIEAHKKRVEELSSPFFKLCLSTAGVDIWTLLTNYFGSVFAKWGWFVRVYIAMGKPYERIYLYFAWSTGICQAMSVSVLASNRLSVMLFPTKFHRFWQGYRLWLAIGIQYSTGLLIGLSTFANPTQLFRNGRDGLLPKFLNRSLSNTFFAIGGVFLFTNCLYLVLTYCYLFWVLHKRHKKMTLHRSNTQLPNVTSKLKERAKTREARLFTMSTTIVCVQLVVLCFFVLRAADIVVLTSDEFYLYYNAMSDLYASSNAYLLVIFSDALRSYILQRFGIKKNASRITSVNPTV